MPDIQKMNLWSLAALSLLLTLTACGEKKQVVSEGNPTAGAASSETPAAPGDKPTAKLVPTVPADEVALTFGWPAGLTAEVEYRKSRTQAGTLQFDTKLTTTLQVEARDKGLAVAFRNWRGGGDEPLARAGLALAGAIVTVVDEKGAVKGIEGVDEADALIAAVPGVAELEPAARQFLREKAPRAAAREAADLWGSLVDTWADQRLEMGVPYTAESKSPVGVIDDEIRLTLTVKVLRRLPCPGHADKQCVEARMTSVPNGTDTERVVQTMLDRMGAASAATVTGLLEQLDVTSEITLIAEPQTLVPHDLHIVRTLTTKARGARVDEKRYTFRYPSP